MNVYEYQNMSSKLIIDITNAKKNERSKQKTVTVNAKVFRRQAGKLNIVRFPVKKMWITFEI